MSVKTARHLKYQSDLYNQEVHGSPYKSEITCASFFPRHHGENPRNSIDCGVAHFWWLRSCQKSLIEGKNSKIVSADWWFISTGLSHTRGRSLTTDHPRERCHRTCKRTELADEGDIDASIVPSPVEHNTEPRIEPPCRTSAKY